MAMSEPGAGERYSKAYVWYAMGVVLLVAMFNVIDRTIVSMLVPGIKADLSLDDQQIGILLGPSFAVVHFLAVLPAAWIADRTSRRTVIAASLFVWSGMTAAGGLARGFWDLFATRMGVGIGEAGGAPPSVSLLSDTAPESMRAQALSAITIGSLVGIGVGLMAGGVLAAPLGWRGTLVAVGAPGAAIALLVRFTLREPSRGSVVTATPLAAARHLFALPSFRWMVLAAVFAGVGSMGRTMWEPEFVRRVYGYEGLDIGLTVFIYGAIPTALGAYLGGAIADRLQSRDARWPLWVCAIGNLGSAPLLIAFLLWPVESRLAGLPTGFAFWIAGSVLIGFFSAPMGAMAQRLARPNMRALAHAIWTMIFTGIGQGAGPWVVGALTDFWRVEHGASALRYAMAATTVTVCLSGLLYVRAARWLPTDLAALDRREA
jgi:MFS family permease